jgi:hypothetical protein
MVIMAKRPRSSRIDTYIERLERGDVRTRCRAASKLSRWTNIVVVKHLCEALQDSDRRVRREAAKSLAIIGDASAVEPLVKMVGSDTSIGAIKWGVRALGRMADPAAVPTLLKVAVRAKSNLEIEAREALDEIGTAAVGELCRALNSSDEPLHHEATEGIKRIHRHRRPAVGSFPGGLVVEAVMTAEGLLPQQRMLAIEAALSCRLLYRSPERISADAARLCERLASQYGDETIRRNAETVLSYVSLCRPSTAADQPGILLRAAPRRSPNDGRDTLGRALAKSMKASTVMPAESPGSRWRSLTAKLRRRKFEE